VLKLHAGAEELQAQKRLVLNARDLSQWNPELAANGWQVCPPPPAEAPPGCLAVRPRAPNQNPAIAGFEAARGERADTPFTTVDGPLLMAPGEKLRVRPVLAAGAEEAFQVIESSLQSNELVVSERTEELVTSWFSTAGEFAQAQTARQLTKTLDSTFTAPAAPPAGGRFVIHVVVRDQRGGVGWSRIDVVMQ
jgi:hypothetical protein